MQDPLMINQALIEENALLRERIRELELSESDLNRVQEVLRKSEEKYSQLSENANDAILSIDLDGIILYANRAASDLARPLNLIGMSMRDITHVSFVQNIPELLRKRREGDNSTFAFEWELTAPDSGKHIIMDVHSSLLTENGKPSGVLIIARDVTDRRLWEKALSESEQRYKSLVENANDAIYVAQDGMLKFVNRRGVEISGYSEQELMSKPFFEFIHFDDRAMMREYHLKRLSGERFESCYAFRLISKNGDIKWLELRVALIDFNGRPATLNFVSDITKRKLLDETLRLQGIQLRAIVESTGNGVLVIDYDGKVILSNRRFADLWNIPHDLLEKGNDEALLAYVSNQLVYPDAFLERVKLLYQSTITDYDMILFKDGRRMERYSYPLLSEGTIKGRVWSFRDITDQYRVEADRRNSELLFKNAFSMSPVMMGIHRLNDRMFLEINEIFVQYTGYPREEIIGHTIAELGLLDSATMERLRRIFSEKNAISNEEIKYKTKTGELRDGLYSATLIEEREERKVLGLLYDITERKHSEVLLKLREEESRMLAKNLEEANIALRVVLSRREEDQRTLEEKIQSNVNEIILPFIDSLKGMNRENRDRHYLDLIESNLKSILSPFVKNMSGKYPNLTPKEMQIAEMIRQGKNSKDIAAMLGTSIATVNTHRNNIRKKLNVRKQKTNLRSHLLSQA